MSGQQVRAAYATWYACATFESLGNDPYWSAFSAGAAWQRATGGDRPAAGSPAAPAVQVTAELRRAAERTREDLGPAGRNYPDVRALLAFAEAAIAAAPTAQAALQPMTRAAQDVLAERRRQVEAEGWTPEHDDEHADGSLAEAAGCYALWGRAYPVRGSCPAAWPWDAFHWKPKTARENYVRAAAMLLAELERMDRVQTREGEGGRNEG